VSAELWAYKVVALSLEVSVSRTAARRAGSRPEFDSIAAVLNEYGRQGWELVTVVNEPEIGAIAFLKRKFVADQPNG